MRPALAAAAMPVLAATMATGAGAADEPAYRDDRSDPAAIVASYYNAIARHEYARAWSYFGDEKPVADYLAFVAGFAATAGVTAVLGTVRTEGAAGSVYGAVPVAIAATAADGETTVYAGCYTTRQLQPAAQEPPFRPLEIVAGKLARSEGALDAAVPGDCPAP
jgi:hypothetical protein